MYSPRLIYAAVNDRQGFEHVKTVKEKEKSRLGEASVGQLAVLVVGPRRELLQDVRGEADRRVVQRRTCTDF